MCGHTARYAEHMLSFFWSPWQRFSCEVYSTSREQATVSKHSWCEKNPAESECKVAGVDNVPERVLKTCAEQRADFITGNSGKEEKQIVSGLETSQTSMVHHGPGQEGSTMGD